VCEDSGGTGPRHSPCRASAEYAQGAASSSHQHAAAQLTRNAPQVGECWVSPPLLNELQDRADIEVLEGGLTAFDDDGNLKPFEGAADDLGATDAKRQKTQ
jgi:hypothetical protein